MYRLNNELSSLLTSFPSLTEAGSELHSFRSSGCLQPHQNEPLNLLTWYSQGSLRRDKVYYAPCPTMLEIWQANHCSLVIWLHLPISIRHLNPALMRDQYAIWSPSYELLTHVLLCDEQLDINCTYMTILSSILPFWFLLNILESYSFHFLCYVELWILNSLLTHTHFISWLSNILSYPQCSALTVDC